MPAPPTIAMVEYIANDWFHITLLTKTHLVTSMLTASKRKSVLSDIQSGSDPIATIQKASPFGQPAKTVALTQMLRLEWHEDNEVLYARYLDSKTSKVRRCRMLLCDDAKRRQMIDAIRNAAGCEFEEGEQLASIWHTGIRQFIVSGFAALWGMPAIVGMFVGPGRDNTDNVFPSRARALGDLYRAVGNVGMLAASCTVIAAMMVWWWIACQNPPKKKLLTAVWAK